MNQARSRAAQIRNGTLDKTPLERLMAWVNMAESGCWEWQGHLNFRGYGEFSIDRKRWKAHRYSWVLANGAIPDGVLVLHRCDDPACVNPDHLFLGTHTDNMQDASRKGRMPGINSRLSAEDVRQMRALSRSLSVLEIATQFDVDEQTARDAIQRKSWRHVE